MEDKIVIRMLRAVVCACLLGAALAAPAAAGKPTMEVIHIADVGILDEFLTETCGFDVFFDGAGHFTLRSSPIAPVSFAARSTTSPSASATTRNSAP